MKSETTNLILIFALSIFAALDVLFAVRAVNGERELRSLQIGMSQSQTGLIQLQQLQSLVNEAREYNKKTPSPELTRILEGTQTKPATH